MTIQQCPTPLPWEQNQRYLSLQAMWLTGALHATISSTSDSVHSGFIVSAPLGQIGLPEAPVGTTRFRVTFTNPGVYPFICALHDDLGMKGRIIVLP
jgi:hypothetical protein